ncbi:MAG TPA: 3'-5' exonuclease [Patescibacteria group bacterium]|jgi:DNA polymerase III epsilon subunit-like protein|nr:3'-5' exonuclease [Patescibacteria group bacterium]
MLKKILDKLTGSGEGKIGVAPDQLYCSVDLEFTGFDPSKDQILEIGFAFFRMSEKGAEITEQWSQVFKSSIEVHPKILGLTGITQAELDAAPDFNEHREFLQEKLGNAIIVGHNPVMDVKFLEAYGLKLSGKIVDTLELVQFILPTHHSYNLENLVHYFGVKHHNAHRALGDAISTVEVLENLVRVYNAFSPELKNELLAVANRGDFLWKNLFAIELDKKDIEQNDSLAHSGVATNIEPLQLSEGLVTIDNTSDNHAARVALGLKEKKSPAVLAVESSATVMKLWQDGLVHGVFKTDDTFSKEAFEKFLQTASTNEELRFCLKIIVWLHTNWQTEVVFDLNISFFGGQFRSSIVGGTPRIGDELILCVDYTTLQTENSSLKNRNLVIVDIQNFEKFMSTGFGTRLSWSSVLYSLKLVYNPETDFGEVKIKDEVLSALAGADLFFGLVYMLLHQTFPSNQYATVEELENNQPHILKRLQTAAETLKNKLQAVQDKTQATDLTRTIGLLETFFHQTEGRVKWVTIDERNLSFHDQPIDIAASVQKVIEGFSHIAFTETIAQPILLSYLVDRLGLRTEISEFIDINEPKLPRNLNVVATEQTLNSAELYQEVIGSPLPLVVIFPDLISVKNFYNDHYSEIKEKAALFAQGYSGGGNKMFRNFSIKENSMLLVTADFMAKQNYKISAQTVIFTAQPGVEKEHPYTSAILKHWGDKHSDLISAFQAAKIVSALKKLKLSHGVLVKMYNVSENNIFVDNSR